MLTRAQRRSGERLPRGGRGIEETMGQDTKSQSETRGRLLRELDGVDLESTMLTTGQAASYLNVSQPTVVRLIKKQGLPAIKLQRRYRIPRGPFEEWVRDRAVGSGEGDE